MNRAASPTVNHALSRMLLNLTKSVHRSAQFE
jgi:hypothetical protein